jgi:hypothetical protein
MSIRRLQWEKENPFQYWRYKNNGKDADKKIRKNKA